MKPSRTDIEIVTRSIISAWLIDQVRVRALFLQRLLLGLAVVCLPFAVFASGFTRAFAFIWMCIFAFFGLGGMFVRWLAIFAIRRFAAPRRFDEYRTEVDAVIQDADLPTTPLAALRLVIRLKRGVRGEVERLRVLGVRVAQIVIEPPPPLPPEGASDT